jgi:hypothetical protein
MNVKRSLQNRIRGWLPKEPLNPNKQMPIKLESNPVKFKYLFVKSPSVIQFIVVVLSLALILGGLYLNSISTTRHEYSLPISSTTYNMPFEYDGNNYNCCIYLSTVPPLTGSGIGPANTVCPIYVYLKQQNNLTSGIYFENLRYLSYNSSIDAYVSKETNSSRLFSAEITTKNKGLVISAFYLHPPFEEGNAKQPIVSGVYFTIYCNSTGDAGASSFDIKTPIDATQSGYVVNYPYRNIGNILLAIGVLSLFLALFLSMANVKRSFSNYPAQEKAADNRGTTA